MKRMTANSLESLLGNFIILWQISSDAVPTKQYPLTQPLPVSCYIPTEQGDTVAKEGVAIAPDGTNTCELITV